MKEYVSTINADNEMDLDIKIKSEHREKRLSERYDETAMQESRRKKLINTFYKSWIYISCIFVRLIFLAFLIIGIHFLKCVYDNWAFILLYACPLLIILEGSYVLFKRKGYDPYWFSLSVASFLIGMSVIISYQGNFIYRIHHLHCESNHNQTSSYADCLPISINMCRFIENIIVYYVLLLVFARWMLPQHKKITSEQVYQQIFMFTVVSADAIELGDYMYELENMYYLMKGIQISFSLSLVQFCFSLLGVKKRNYELTGFAKFINILLSTEAWSLIFVILTQEIPAFVMRVILLMTLYGIVSDSLIFFTIKNLLLIILFTYRAIKLMRVEYQLDKEANERIQKTISN